MQPLIEAKQAIHHLIVGSELERAVAYNARREMLVRDPVYELYEDYTRIYENGDCQVGFPTDIARVFDYLAKDNVYVILGAQLGDEGKGRVVDNILDYLVNRVGLRKVYVTRFQGGSNAGHTVEVQQKKVKLHQIPSMVFQPENVQVVGIMDAGMNLNPDDLRIEHDYVEAIVGKDALKGCIVVSQYAVLNTDLDRAEEALLDIFEGKTSGSTSEGMRTSSAHFYDRTGLRYEEFLADDWKERLGKKYDQLAARFALCGKNLEEIMVPDYEKVVEEELREIAQEQQHGDKGERQRPMRKVGTKEKFLERLEDARSWLIENDFVHDTIEIHQQSLYEVLQHQAGHIFEGAQGLGLHPWLGTIGSKDTTSTDTSPTGVLYATKVITVGDIRYKIGVFKATYMSSVGRRIMLTEVPLDKKIRKVADLPLDAGEDEKWAAWVREEANEFGTTTGRPRDICFLDLPFFAYNCLVGNINMLAATHLDIAQKGKKIKVCTHYSRNKRVIPYSPGIDGDPTIRAHYLELDGWDPKEVQNAKSYEELPEAAKKYLAFVQARVGVPIVFSTTGPDRENYIRIPEVVTPPRRGTRRIVESIKDRISPRGRIFPN